MSVTGFSYYFVIVGRSDNPLFELEYSTKGADPNLDHRYLTQFVAHAALDLVEEHSWTTPNMYLKCVDKFNEWFVTAFVGGNSRIKFLLLHNAPRIDENNIKNFFLEMYELYTKFALNPLYVHHTPIQSKAFEKKSNNIAKKYLP
ncbi:trafficking protein particle complex subunit 2 [Dermatophagoides pteronyssinus]|uniref:Trafficking protein particle complex subunit 2 n=2 Tax=Dermatophagoides pteronyssinus TaxID=6956 RepID=A0ABQ8JV81_DERPT|nr:trafficking protein particle complex subunit 2-like [Dermatophagoides pteronyssinus]KAH9418524.1 Trafficking protein particle complex subunit 2 [Dermatophagoides pteronyssinus]KAH9426375.1 Trafficking protein particle complex subunit 2 [Dermatophagoides pteronyssinus]